MGQKKSSPPLVKLVSTSVAQVSSGCIWLIRFVSSGFILCSCMQSTQPSEMSADQALLLTKAWCQEARASFDQVKVSSNGDFRGVFGAAEIAYTSDQKRLLVEGLIINDATVMAEYPELFEEFERVGNRESYTLGEGNFYIEKKPFGKAVPQLTLRKDFVDGSIKPKQFVLEVDWLMRWSTYWSLQRSRDVRTKREEELIKQAPGIEAWARRNSPRPW